MNTRKIFSESPEDDLWQLIAHYSYPNNISKYLISNGTSNQDTKLIENISGSISQAKEYYYASKEVK